MEVHAGGCRAGRCNGGSISGILDKLPELVPGVNAG